MTGKPDMVDTFRFVSLDDDDAMELMYLMHDKTHVSAGPAAHIPALERALGSMSVDASVTLFRGVKDVGELASASAGTVVRTSGYLSFSEDESVAEEFAGPSGVVMVLEGGSGFPYWRWVVREMSLMKERDPEEYRDADGDFVIDSAREESEWILPMETSFRVLDWHPGAGATRVSVAQVEDS